MFGLVVIEVMTPNINKMNYFTRGKYFSFGALKPGGTSLKNWQFGEPFLLAQSAKKMFKQARDCRKKYSLIKRRNFLIIFLSNKEGH